MAAGQWLCTWKIALVVIVLTLSGCGYSSTPPRTFEAGSTKALVLLHTRVAPGLDIPEGSITFTPYDKAAGRLGAESNVPGREFSVGRGIGLISNASMHEWQAWAVQVEPGSYVLASMANPNLGPSAGSTIPQTYAFDVAPGTVTYIGDYSLHFTPTEGLFAFHVSASHDEERARRFVSTNTVTSAPFVTAPLRPVTLTPDGEDGWIVSNRR